MPRVFHLPGGTDVSAGVPFSLATGEKFPDNWLALATAKDLAQWGITFTDVADPAPVPPGPPTVSSLVFISGLFTQAEQVAIMTAAQTDPQIALFVAEASAADAIVLTDPSTQNGLAYLVAKKLLTQDRANAITTGTPPAP